MSYSISTLLLLRGNRFYRRPERSHCFGLSLFRQSSLRDVGAIQEKVDMDAWRRSDHPTVAARLP